ncbi:hypothetical protein Ahy_A03g015198 [Arachis hypogaea]|uniref:Uncharacterized protein n=1 Tax=Arachis hypogaea TaxID=3818 RepID=A0A445DZX4_ARAHY|nr:hypothetical protein Ahy_A03g015198 [Arachis hypogaea]
MASSSAKKPINCTPKAFKKPENYALKAVDECRPEAISVEKPSKCEQKAVLIEKTADVEDVVTAITGIALPAGSDKLISGSIDGTVRAWDCNTGRCVNMIHLNSQVTEEGTLEVTYTHTNQIVSRERSTIYKTRSSIL